MKDKESIYVWRFNFLSLSISLIDYKSSMNNFIGLPDLKL